MYDSAKFRIEHPVRGNRKGLQWDAVGLGQCEIADKLKNQVLPQVSGNFCSKIGQHDNMNLKQQYFPLNDCVMIHFKGSRKVKGKAGGVTKGHFGWFSQ